MSMYQDRWACGYEIRWSRPGPAVECWVVKATGSGETERFRGTHDQCVRWLMDRGVRHVTPLPGPPAKTYRFEVVCEWQGLETKRFIVAGTPEEAVATFRADWSDGGDEIPPAACCRVTAIWAAE